MSVEAISWALNLAPVPSDRGGQPSSACKFVLVGLANHAGPDGSGAFPSVRTLIRYTGLSERTVRACLGRLESAGLIRPCDPAIVAARIKRADRRPNGWDLDLTLIRDDLDEIDVAVLERQFPGLAARLAVDTQPSTGRLSGDGVQPPHPVAAVDNLANGVRRLHRETGTRCIASTNGVQSVPVRGAVIAPEPYSEPSQEPPSDPAHASAAAEVCHLAGGRLIEEFFAGLDPAWQLTLVQQSRIAAAIRTALISGWTPRALAAYVGSNTTGVRNCYAVLTARLSPAELPAPPGPRSSRPPWCGDCDERTRRRQAPDGADAGRCQDCHPLAAKVTSAQSLPTGRKRLLPPVGSSPEVINGLWMVSYVR